MFSLKEIIELLFKYASVYSLLKTMILIFIEISGLLYVEQLNRVER